MRFYGFEERFVTDAKMAELSGAKAHILIRKFKRAFLANRLSAARLGVFLLPLLTMLVPTGKAVLSLPFFKEEIPVSALGIYNIFSSGTLSFIGSMTSSEYFGNAFSALQLSIFAFAAAAVCAVLILLCTILCFISIKNMARLLCAFSVLGTVCSVASTVLVNNFATASKAVSAEILSGSTSLGCIVAALAFAVVFTLNLLVAKRGLPVEYDEGALERAEIAKKVKSGEIKLEDLPQPIVETAETRAIEAEIEKERQKYTDKHADKEVTADA